MKKISCQRSIPAALIAGLLCVALAGCHTAAPPQAAASRAASVAANSESVNRTATPAVSLGACRFG
jgi:hypothetical protein